MGAPVAIPPRRGGFRHRRPQHRSRIDRVLKHHPVEVGVRAHAADRAATCFGKDHDFTVTYGFHSSSTLTIGPMRSSLVVKGTYLPGSAALLASISAGAHSERKRIFLSTRPNSLSHRIFQKVRWMGFVQGWSFAKTRALWLPWRVKPGESPQTAVKRLPHKPCRSRPRATRSKHALVEQFCTVGAIEIPNSNFP